MNLEQSLALAAAVVVGVPMVALDIHKRVTGRDVGGEWFKRHADLFAEIVMLLAGLAALAVIGFGIWVGWRVHHQHQCQTFTQRCVDSKVFTLIECQRQAFEKYECMPARDKK